MNYQLLTEWKPGYSVGNAILDCQHKRLLHICQQAISCMDDEGPEGTSKFHNILNDLAEYVKEHFQTEEAILKSCGYPLLDTHKQQHIEYQAELMEFLLSATLGKFDKAGLVHYLSEWWINHILKSDMQYSDTIARLAVH